MDTLTAFYQDLEQITKLVKEFEACTLQGEKWTHYAHLTVGIWYLSRYSQEEATKLIRQNILRYNASRGVIMTKDSGYHETITLFYVWVIKKHLKNSKKEKLFLDLVNGLIDEFGDKKLPFKYYSKERLMSWAARTNWLEPDLLPLT